MEDLCRWLRPIGEVDMDAITGRIARAEPVLQVPRRLRRTSAARLLVIVDHSERLGPFWRDQHEVSCRIEAELGVSGVHCQWWYEGMPHGGGDVDPLDRVASGLGPGDVVVVLGDLGHYGTEELQQAWAKLGAAIEARGAAAVALLPCPRSRWHDGVVRSWRAVDWSAPDRRVVHGRLDEKDRERRCNDLLALVSWVVRIEPALLREVRMVLPPGDADVGTEADAWNHGGARRHPSGLLLPRGLRMAAQRRLVEMMRQERWQPVVTRVVDVVRRRHAARTRELWMEEARNLLWLDPEGGWIDEDERRWVEVFSTKVRALYELGAGAGRLGAGVDVHGWVDRTLVRVPEHVWRSEDWCEELMPAFMALHGGDRIELLPGMDVGMLPLIVEGAPVRSFAIRQVVDSLVVEVASASEEGTTSKGSPVATVAARERLSVTWGEAGRVVAYAVGIGEPTVIPLEDGPCVISTDVGERVQLRLEPRPAWAEAMGRDRQGLWVQYRGQVLEWPQWASGVGEDEFGLWATFVVKGVEQRMRWIAPGTFVMGSPEGEAGRHDHEGPQHWVTLSAGYWLADTPCTQELWTVVMGSNPSRFQSSRRPVEQVSWDDVQEFLMRLNELVPGLEADLPTEAQWEHACRAGTTTATYAGDLVIQGANNAPVLDDIAWYGGNSGVDFELEDGWDSSNWPDKQYPHARAGTHEVGLKQPNRWGLYDMLGNVLEWCADMPRDYSEAAVTDPRGDRSPQRVLHGGGWYGFARDVRAADRYWDDSSLRDDDLGFRLARGQGLRPASQEQGRGTRPAS